MILESIKNLIEEMRVLPTSSIGKVQALKITKPLPPPRPRINRILAQRIIRRYV